MNFELFIAKRIIGNKQYKSSVSGPIIKIAIAAIALGMIMMLIAIASGVGLQVKIREKVAAFNGHIQIYNFDTNYSEVSVTPVSKKQEFYPQFNLVSGVNHIQAVAAKGGIIRTEDTFEGIIAKGVGTDYNWSFFEEYLVKGRLPDYSSKLNNETLISEYLAKRLNLNVGDSFFSFFLKDDGGKIPNQRKFTIVGTYDSDFEEFDATYIFIDIRHIQRMNKWTEDQIGAFELFIDDFSQISEIGNAIYGKTLSTLDSQSIVDKYDYIFEWIRLFDFNIAIIIGIMILVGSINMITALLVLILERTQMVGVLKALGTVNWSIRKIFLYNASYLILIGMFWGNVIGIGILLAQKYGGFVKLDPATYYVDKAPVHIEISHIIFLNLGTLLLCFTMLLIPSFIITKITPVKAIRFE
ncbi:ABC transporter permease [Ascidiimonas sp. W6]|uniref:ABC transporter permease n=1 Tax=Ascidiimonas meishanensis TaxID=3128903 RepID=UPI0030EBCEAA